MEMVITRGSRVEQLMLQYFPSCPLCGANAGYKVASLTGRVVCRSCEATWVPIYIGMGKGLDLKALKLWKADNEGKSKFLVKKTKPVSFWQFLDLERERIGKEIEELFRRLKTKDPKVRSEVQKRLRELGEPVLMKISEMSKDASSSTRKEALWLLGLMEDERGEELLIKALKEDEDEQVRGQAVMSLGLIEDAKKTGKAIEPLIEALKNDTSPDIRATSAQVLAFMKDLRVIEALIQALNDKGYSTRARATVQQWAAAALVKIGDKRGIAAIAAMTPLLLGTRWIPVDQIVRLGKPAVEPLIQVLKDEHWEVRLKAAEALGKIKDPKAVEPLIQALKDGNDSVRQKVAFALGDIGNARALEALTQAKEDKSWFVRQAAKAALKKIQKRMIAEG